MGGAATGYVPHLFGRQYKGCIDLILDDNAGLNIVCSYAEIVQLKFRYVQSKRTNCADNC